MTSLQERSHVDAAGASSVLVVDPNLDSRLDAVTAVKQAGLPLAGEAPYGAEATFLEADRAPALILVALEEPPMRGIATIEAIRRQNANAAVVVYSSSAAPELLRQAMRAGARDFLAKPLSARDVTEALAFRADGPGDDGEAPGNRERGTGTVITVAGAKGGIGKSTLAANLAVALREITSQDVALLDTDVQFGDIGVIFDVEPPHDRCVSYLGREGVTLSRDVVAESLIRHESGIDILAVLPEPNDWRVVRPEQVARLARALAETHEYVVVDTPGTINEVVAAALCEADVILLVTSLEMSSIKDTKTAVRVLGSLGVDSGRIRLVINDSTSASAITPDDVAEATGLPVATSIPHDRQLGRSVQRGVPVYLEHRGGTFPRAVADLAGSLAGVTTGSRRRRLPFLR